MKWIKLFEDFKQNNQEGLLIKIEDIIKAKNDNEKIYATIIENIPENDPKIPLEIQDIDEDGYITIYYKDDDKGIHKTGGVELNNVERIGNKKRGL